MIESISIKNIALIDELSIDFNHALTVLSGETGAGKSILIGALHFLLGAKVHTDIIRTGAVEASVSGVFYLPRSAAVGTYPVANAVMPLYTHSEHTMYPRALAWLAERDIELDNNRILLRRTLRNTGRGSIWIQNTAVSRLELEEFTSFFVDIHGQHAHQSLFKTAEHRRFLDSYAGILEKISAFTRLYIALADTKTKLEKIRFSEKERLERMDYLSFVIDEIGKARLLPAEDEQLEGEESKLCQYEKLHEQIELLASLCTDEHGIVPLLKRLYMVASTASAIDSELSDYAARAENAYYELQDIGDFFGVYREKLVFEPDRLEQVQDRLALINKLKKKYGTSIEAIHSFAADAQNQLEALSCSEESKTCLMQQVADLESQLLIAGQEISAFRVSAAEELETKLQHILYSLDMPKVQFSVSVQTRVPLHGEQTISADQYGFDKVEFLVSANSGEPLKPLNKVASGGELSRIMLALKTVLAVADETDTLVFDEIDTGIGGETARAVAEHLKKLATEKQILCITHLAVIAACADTHIKIEKIQSGDSSRTYAAAVTEDARIDEIARMLAGDEISEASRIHARELLEHNSRHKAADN